MNHNKVLSIYGSHDASVTFIDKNKKLRIYEYERFVKKRYAMFSSRFDSVEGMGSNDSERNEFLTLIKNNIGDEDIQSILYLELNENDKKLLNKYFPNASFTLTKHHYSHACSGYFSSKFNNSLIFSIDGGGYDFNQVFMTRCYLAKENEIKELECINFDFGNAYSGVAWLISEIKGGSKTKTLHSLSNAGKIMGLCAYGKIRTEWIKCFENYYITNDINTLCNHLKIPCTIDCVSGQFAYDIAATSQYVFEKKMDELILPFVEKYNTNIVLVGGCALNVLYNQKLSEKLKKINLNIFIPSNPNDCGLSYGMFLSKFPELGRSNEICYSGIEILDENELDFYLEKYPSENLTISKIVNYLIDGKILGLINNYSEVGPRSLGNRSIICNPSFPEMKDILNSKVKFREWFRPFAPVCRLKDKDLFFENANESSYMSFAPKIKEIFKNKVQSIVHQDETTRLQTVTQETHELFNDILDELEIRNNIPIILNTSFNIKGFPILTTYKDAFYVLDNTELDFLIIKNKIFSKK
jgi:carbamoyltransferase